MSMENPTALEGIYKKTMESKFDKYVIKADGVVILVDDYNAFEMLREYANNRAMDKFHETGKFHKVVDTKVYAGSDKRDISNMPSCYKSGEEIQLDPTLTNGIMITYGMSEYAATEKKPTTCVTILSKDKSTTRDYVNQVVDYSIDMYGELSIDGKPDPSFPYYPSFKADVVTEGRVDSLNADALGHVDKNSLKHMIAESMDREHSEDFEM